MLSYKESLEAENIVREILLSMNRKQKFWLGAEFVEKCFVALLFVFK
jgi:hypothetical protein